MRNGTILLADGDAHYRLLLKRVLLLEGYEILESGNGVEARVFCDHFAGAIDLLLVDLRLPDLELIEGVRGEAPIIYMAGPSGSKALVKPVGRANCVFVLKPFRVEVLLEKVRERIPNRERSGAGTMVM